jgi:hypothetical protein
LHAQTAWFCAFTEQVAFGLQPPLLVAHGFAGADCGKRKHPAGSNARLTAQRRRRARDRFCMWVLPVI